MQSIIQTKNLSKAYNLGKTNQMWALEDVSVNIYPGEYVVFFGPSGCGKSTLLYTIASLEIPTKGEVMVDGKNLKNLTPKELIKFHQNTVGMIFQAYYLIPTLSVRDNILLPKIFANHSKGQRGKRADTLMKRFGIFHLQNRKPSLLSGGQQQRVAIARALIQDPPIILADEPVGNLDSKNAEIVLDLLDGLSHKDKKTIVHVTHNPQDIMRANRVFYMKDGKVIRETRNPGKYSMTGKTDQEVTELERLAQAYPYLTESRLRAKFILSHLMFPLGIEVQQDIEKAIDDYLTETITQTRLFDILDNPPEKGGVNLYTQKARKLSEDVIKLATEIKMGEGIEKNVGIISESERAKELRGYILDDYKGVLTMEQINRIEELFLQRIIGKLTRVDLEHWLDIPLDQKGVGLNRRTAKRFSRQVDLILMR